MILAAMAGLVASVASGQMCDPCHTQIVRTYAASPMGRALSRPTGTEIGTFQHADSGSRVRVEGRGGKTLIRIERGGLTASYEALYQVGSGNHAKGYVVQAGKGLYQAPVAFYRNGGRWDVAPGYESMPVLDFNRPVSEECLNCHSGEARPIAGTANQYESPAVVEEGITCGRCHGPAEAHLAKPGRGTILNPARMGRAERDSVCESCHLTGEARVPNPGKNITSYKPGGRTEASYSTFTFSSASGDLRVVSHVEQLEQSKCFRSSAGKLWCTACHDPHGGGKDVSNACKACHTDLPQTHAAKTDCASCHMPKKGAVDGLHSAFTDHRIGVPGRVVKVAAESELKPWRGTGDEALDLRNRGLALLIVGEKQQSVQRIQEAFRLLTAVYPKFPNDPDVLAGLGMILFLRDQKSDALKLLNAAAKLRPGSAELQEKIAVVSRASGLPNEAIGALRRAIAIDPYRETPYFLLHEINPALKVLEDYLKLLPQSLIAQEALRGSRL